MIDRYRWAGPLSLVERAAAFVAACSLVLALPLTDEIGIAMAALLFIVHAVRVRRAAPAT